MERISNFFADTSGIIKSSSRLVNISKLANFSLYSGTSSSSIFSYWPLVSSASFALKQLGWNSTSNKQWNALMEIFPWNGSLKKQTTCRLLYKTFEEYFLWNFCFSCKYATLQQYLSESSYRICVDSHHLCQSSLISTLYQSSLWCHSK